jgi:acetyl esterase/lipase
MRHTLTLLLFIMTIELANAAAPKVELLWPDGAPGAKGDRPADKPTLTVFRPEHPRADGAAVVICPGGGYGGTAMDHEGWQIGRWFSSLGVTGVVLDYRHHGRGYQHPAPLEDAQRAIRTIRARAEAWQLSPKRIGILGFSAGGHLASTAGTHFDPGDPNAADPIARVSCRPDFLVLCYAVIAFGEPYTHHGSQQNLLGTHPDPALVRSLSNEKQVTRETPPTFLWHTDEDAGVPAENSVQFYLALRRAHVPAELHIFRKGQHGLGFAPDVPGTNQWRELLKTWMQAQGLIGKS